jgi:hypothetical protein
MKAFWKWFLQTATLVGVPVLFIVLITALEKTFFTLTCVTAGYKCEDSLLMSGRTNEFIGELFAGEAPSDSDMKKSKR